MLRLNAIDRLLLRSGALLVRHRVVVLGLVLAVAALLSAGLGRLRIGFQVDGFFRSEDPELMAAVAHYHRDTFEPPDRLLLFGWPESQPTGTEALSRLGRFTEVAEQHDVVQRVITLRNAPLGGGRDPASLASSSTWRRILVSSQGDAVGGVILLQPGFHHDEVAALCAELVAAAASAGRELRLCGLPYHMQQSRELVRGDLAHFLPIGVTASTLLLLWLVPHLALALLALLVVPLTVCSTLGTMGWLGLRTTMLTSTLPTLLLCMSVADALHLVARFLEERDRDGDARAAAIRTFAAMFGPCLVTSLTTIVGFVSLCRAELSDLAQLGTFAALGMALAFVFTLLVLPAAMSWVSSPRGARPPAPAASLLRWARRLQLVSPWWWITGCAAVTTLAAVATTRLETDHRMTADLWPDSPVMQQLAWYEARFLGVMPAEVLVTAPRRFDADERAELAGLCRRLEDLPGVRRTLSVADLYADGLDASAVRWLAAGGALPGGLLDRDGRTARILVFRPDLGTMAWQRFAGDLAELATHRPGLGIRLVGMQRIGTEQVLRMTKDLQSSFVGSVVVIFLLVWLSCRRIGAALVAMLACLVPLLLVLGTMSLLGITLRPLTVIAFCVAIGLLVDDAIHLIARWQEERARGRSPDRAVQATLRTAGRPVVVTSLVLLSGFLTILVSGFRGTAVFGFLVDLSLVVALLAALVLLPALLRIAPRRAPRARQEAAIGGPP